MAANAAADRWMAVEGQERSRPLSHTLPIAQAAGRRAGVTRLADVSGLTPFRVPVFQAVRPLARSISVTQGKGLTPMAAKVSALLEAAELSVAENLSPPADGPVPTGETLDAWSTAPRHRRALRLDPALPRRWLEGRCLLSGRRIGVPWDLVALDYTGRPEADVRASSSGLASGNDTTEAAVGAVGELLERDLAVLFDEAGGRDRRALEVDPGTVDDPLLRRLFARIAGAGFDVRLWSIGQPLGIAALRCALFARGAHAAVPPCIGSGCHPTRRVATLRAVLEAVQVHATLVAGARDDLCADDYADPDGRKRDLLFETLSLARADRDWRSVPDDPQALPARSLDRLLAVAARRSSLPVAGIEHDSGVPGLSVFRAVAPGLADAARTAGVEEIRVSIPHRVAAKTGRPPVLFVGPTLARGDVPPGIEVRPPAVAGDMAALLADPPAAVGLIDGLFETAPTVWHKEILHLLAIGVPVLGAASLGALRAAELDTLGMVGVGRIYAAYHDGVVERDDAVMLSHAPGELGFRPLTVTLVDAEATLAALPMPPRDRRMLLRIMRTLFHAKRSWDRCLTLFADRTGRPPPVDRDTLLAHPSAKRADALELVARLADAATPRTPMPPVTSPYGRLLAGITQAPR